MPCSTNVQHVDCEELLQLMDTAGLAFDKCTAPGKISDDRPPAGTCMQTHKLRHGQPNL